MGRGRQKAKHTKLARELKSYSPAVNYTALERELGGSHIEQDLEKWPEYSEYSEYDTDDDADDDYSAERSA